MRIDGAYSDNYIVRYLPKTENGHFDILIDYGSGAERAVVQKVGSYVQLEASKPTFTIYEVKKDYKNLIICASVLLLGVLVMIFALERKSKKK